MTRWARVARGTVAAVVSLFIAAFSHVLAGGSLPGTAGIALCLAFSVLVCIALVGRRMPRTRLATSIVVSQAMYHWLFGTLGSSTMSTTPPLGHVHNGPIQLGSFETVLHTGSDMLLAHVLAAVATFIVLAFGERSLAATALYARSIVRSLFPSRLGAPTVSTPTAVAPSGHRGESPAARRVDHSGLRHRGPPVLAIS